MRSLVVFGILVSLKALSKVFYRHELRWVGDVPGDPWGGIRVVAFLNHTSLFEPVYLGCTPNRILWQIARRGVIPAASKTIDRPLVGLLYRLVARDVVPITRKRDHTWAAVLDRVGEDSMVVMAPEGRMMRANGLDADGKPMTVRGGIADILESVGRGRLLLAYSGGLHHVQVPGGWPRIFKKVRLGLETLDIAAYLKQLGEPREDEAFRKAVITDLEHRRDRHCYGLEAREAV